MMRNLFQRTLHDLAELLPLAELGFMTMSAYILLAVLT